MAIVQTKPAVRVLPLSQERRKHQRVKIALTGRYMLQNRQEYSCQTLNMSPGGAALMAEMLPRVGEPQFRNFAGHRAVHQLGKRHLRFRQ